MAVTEQFAALTRGAVDLLPAGGLEQKLAFGRPLRVKLGIDPTSPDIHIGFAVVLDRLRAFQEAGHTAVLIVGDYTARIGDPSGRSKERQVLPDDELDANAELFAQQAYRILDPERTELRRNGEWLGRLDYAEVVRLTRAATVAQLLERDDFAKRFAAHEPISLSELLYPLAQGYDSVAVAADVELGGTDQLYNLLAGREVMAAYGHEPQVVLTTPLLVGTDGVEKMSKSRGNSIGITDTPEEQFGKVMSIPDVALEQYWELCLGQSVPAGEPMSAKLELARRIVERYHGPAAAEHAQEHFDRVVRRGETPELVREVPLGEDAASVHLPALLSAELGQSASHWRRVIDQGGVRIDGRPPEALDIPVADGTLIQAGKRQFLRLRRV